MAPGGAARLGRYARQSVAPAAAKPMLALVPEPTQPAVAKEFTVLADPGDVRASRMAKDFATVMSTNGAPGRAIVGATSPNGLGKVLKSDVADFAIVSLDSLLSSAKGDRGMDEARALCRPPGARDHGGDRAA